MRQNPCPVVGEVAKSAHIGLNELDGAVETFCTGFADSMLAIGQQAFPVAPEHLDDLFDRLQLAARCVGSNFDGTQHDGSTAILNQTADAFKAGPLTCSRTSMPTRR